MTVAGRDTALARVQRIVRGGAGHHTRLQLRAEAFADAAALPLQGASALAWPLIGPSAALAILFNAATNAVRAAGALAVSNQLAALLGDGILVKDGRALEALAEVDTVLFDKTGTLTSDMLLVSEVIATGCWTPARVLGAAAAAEGRLTHPLAQALAAAAQRSDCPPLHATATDFRVGFGVSAVIDGERVLVGGRRHLHEAGVPIDQRARRTLAAAEAQGATALLVANAVAVQGVISLRGRERPEAAGILHFLQEHGIAHLALVSGDADEPTRAQARALVTARAQQAQLRRILTYWGGYAVLNTALNLGLRLGVLPSSLLFGAVFGVGLLATRVPRLEAAHQTRQRGRASDRPGHGAASCAARS